MSVPRHRPVTAPSTAAPVALRPPTETPPALVPSPAVPACRSRSGASVPRRLGALLSSALLFLRTAGSTEVSNRVSSHGNILGVLRGHHSRLIGVRDPLGQPVLTPRASKGIKGFVADPGGCGNAYCRGMASATSPECAIWSSQASVSPRQPCHSPWAARQVRRYIAICP